MKRRALHKNWTEVYNKFWQHFKQLLNPYLWTPLQLTLNNNLLPSTTQQCCVTDERWLSLFTRSCHLIFKMNILITNSKLGIILFFLLQYVENILIIHKLMDKSARDTNISILYRNRMYEISIVPELHLPLQGLPH